MSALNALSPSRWLSMSRPVDRASYVATGVVLMLAKYALEVAIVVAVAGVFWSPLVFFSPAASMRAAALSTVDGDISTWTLAAIGVLSLPFLAIGLSMSVRRAADAGLSPWLGLGFAVPGLNYLVMLAFAVLPSRPRPAPSRPSQAPADPGSAARAAAVGVLAASGIGLAIAFVSSDQFALYGQTIFFLLPVAMGALAGFLVNRDADRGVGVTLGTAVASTIVTGGALLLFALEGAICVLMALPIAMVAVCIGALIGRVVARWSVDGAGPIGPSLACVVLLPAIAGLEADLTPATVYEVRSSVVVDASPEVVFEHVVSFPEMPPPTEWYFRSGIAVPLRARIEGEGVGAVRHCEFSTGAFVEPITAWEPGRRLAFDVTAQPPPMQEWSPYRHLHPPHLDASLRSVRGEFRMVPLADGRTRLEGSTWYTLALGPEPYFRLWSDAVIHRVHLRVLDHVRVLAERREH